MAVNQHSPGIETKLGAVQDANALPDNVAITNLDKLANWCRKNSLWPMPFATACCGIELMATGASRHHARSRHGHREGNDPRNDFG